ncbi:hypothetical protein [Sorangium sp. So ce1000]|uniref:hypothetical protein n=1 Tax=Sorangium sp. So ce1000 TaxID=3133325 RepID=UPI003F625321
MIAQLEALLRKYDPLDLIAPIATWQVTGVGDRQPDEETSRSEPLFHQSDVEYALSLALASPYPEAAEPATPDAKSRFAELLTELREKASLHNMFSAMSVQSGEASALQFIMRSWSLFVRGSSYWPFERRICEGVFSGVDSFLREKAGFSSIDFLNFCDRVQRDIEERFSSTVETAHQLLLKMAQTLSSLAPAPAYQTLSNDKELDSLESQVRAMHAADVDTYIEKRALVERKEIFEVTLDGEIHKRIVEQFALKFGDNRDFLEKVPKSRGWPLGPTLVRERPLVRVGERVYAMAFLTLTQSARSIIESLIQRLDPNYFENRYLRHRDRFLEKETVQVMRAWFGESNVYESVYYDALEDGVVKRCELDCLVRFGDVLLLVEAKAGALAPPARRGEIGRLKSDLKKLVVNAHRQAARALSHVHAAQGAVFSDKEGNRLTEVVWSKMSRAFSVNVTLDDLSPVAPNLSRMSAVDGWGDASVLRWTVSLADLLVIQDMLPSPVSFLHYLHRRDVVRHGPELNSSDELDCLMFYLNQGLWINEGEFGPGKVHTVMLDGSFTNELDEYYVRTRCGLPVAKPGLKVPDKLRELVASVDRSPRAAGPSLVFTLLDCDEEGRRKASELIQEIEDRYEQDGKGHSCTIGPIDGAMVLLACGSGMVSQDKVRAWARRWLSRSGIKVAYVLSWVYPLAQSKPRSWKFARNK